MKKDNLDLPDDDFFLWFLHQPNIFYKRYHNSQDLQSPKYGDFYKNKKIKNLLYQPLHQDIFYL